MALNYCVSALSSFQLGEKHLSTRSGARLRSVLPLKSDFTDSDFSAVPAIGLYSRSDSTLWYAVAFEVLQIVFVNSNGIDRVTAKTNKFPLLRKQYAADYAPRRIDQIKGRALGRGRSSFDPQRSVSIK